LRVIILAVLLSFGHFINAQVRPYAPEIFPDKISGAVCGFSNNGKAIYFVREDTIKKKLFLFEADWNGTVWINVRLLPFSGNHNDYGGRLTPDGNTFFFTSDRPGASDKKDDVWNIWKAVRTSSGWKEPEPLRDISSAGDECCPTPIDNNVFLFSGTRGKEEWQIIKADKILPESTLNNLSAWQWPSFYDGQTKTLYFNSMKRPDSRGMDDIYVAEFNAGHWTKVRNLGDAVNTSQYEDGAILSPDRKLLIFCRHETGMTPSRVLCVDVNSITR
jgi:hypothetical protein